MLKKIITLVLALFVVFTFVACGDSSTESGVKVSKKSDNTESVDAVKAEEPEKEETVPEAESTTAPADTENVDISADEQTLHTEEDEAVTAESESHPIVTVEMENGESFKLELYPEYAPQTVANFVSLAESGFYNGLGFHRIVDGFMAQGGDPNGDGTGGAEHNITGEFASNGFTQNTLSHKRGVISMARSADPDSASSQFFICYDDASFLDGQYAAFGTVLEGMEVVDGFLDIERTANMMGELATPVTPIVMKTVTVER